MSKPKILLSGRKNLEFYVDAVNKSGGVADGSYLPEISTDYDGLILCGGCDINPARYGEEINGSVDIDDERDNCEFALFKAYLDAGKPVFGICRGFQLINVYFGGSLYQDIEESAIHTNKSDFYITHSVCAVGDGIVKRLYGSEFTVNGSHHQAVKKLGDGLVPAAFWQDKYIEAFEHKSLPVFAVQWHPERMCYGEARQDTVDGAGMFEHFISLCKNKE